MQAWSDATVAMEACMISFMFQSRKEPWLLISVATACFVILTRKTSSLDPYGTQCFDTVHL